MQRDGNLYNFQRFTFSMEVHIEGETLQFLLHACRSTHPKEFAGFLREKKGVISEVLLVPGTLFGREGSVVNRWMLPIDSSVCGTAHSHPSSNVSPSPSDLRFFSTFGKCHAIVGFPYTEQSIQFYSRTGNKLTHKVVEW
jgi:proteasome lid subunit RPN8/RPN11